MYCARVIVIVAMVVGGCRNTPDRSVPVSTASVSTPLPHPPSVPAHNPDWHWLNPQPQGNALWAVVANHECGVVAVGEASTVMRSTDEGLTWSVHQSNDRWRLKSAAIVGTDVYAVGDSSDNAVVIKIASCGDGPRVTVRTLDSKVDGTANRVAADADGRIFVSTVFHARGRILCSGTNGADLAVCDDLAKQPFYGLFVDKSGRIFAAGGYQGSDGGIVRTSSDHGRTWKTLARHLGTIAYGIWGDPDGKRGATFTVLTKEEEGERPVSTRGRRNVHASQRWHRRRAAGGRRARSRRLHGRTFHERVRRR